jgi:DNA-binding transcriptional regulator YhcF (GntR family)
VPIYEQLVTEIKGMLESGELKPGDSLPTIRCLASQLDVAVNTVAHAYKELERLGLLESKGRKGSFIKARPSPTTEDEKKIFKPSILKLLQKGMNRSEIEQIFNNNMKTIFE